MAQRKAFEVDRGDVRIGYVGEGATRDRVRFTSLSPRYEKVVDDVLSRTTDFDAVLNELKSRGYVLRPVTYREVFK